ncbi:MAG: hypothetical protein ACFB6R_12540 [Alphaproteobacteria bacterium]
MAITVGADHPACAPVLLGTLAAGGCLCCSVGGTLAPADLSAWLREASVSIVTLLPADFLGLTGGHRDGVALPDLRWVQMAGPARETDLERFKRFFAEHARLQVMLTVPGFGPVARLVPDFLPGSPAAGVPLGEPYDDTHISLLGPSGDPVPDGEPGWLAVGRHQRMADDRAGRHKKRSNRRMKRH